MSQTQKFTRIITRQNKRDVMTLAWEVVGKLLEAHESICIEVREKPARSSKTPSCTRC